MWMRGMKTYTKREMAHLLGCSPRTIYEDINHLGLTHIKGDRNLNLYTERDFYLISQLRKHCRDKFKSRESFVPLTVPELLEDEVKIVKLPTSNTTDAIDIERQAIEAGMNNDPFFDLELLQRISDRKWLLPAKRLAPLLGISASYLNSKNRYFYCGFVATKEAYVQNKALWKIESSNSQCLELVKHS